MSTITEKQWEQFRQEVRSDLVRLLKNLKKEIGDEYRASEEDTLPSMEITIASNEDLSDWTYQTGDNSYTGSCYHYPHWGVGVLYRRSDTEALANELLDNLSECYQFE